EAPDLGSPDRLVWDHHVRQIVAYRDRYSIDADSPLGRPVPTEGPMGRARAAAEEALTSLGAVNEAPDAAERDRLREVERRLAWAQTQLSLKALQGQPIVPFDPIHHHLNVGD